MTSALEAFVDRNFRDRDGGEPAATARRLLIAPRLPRGRPRDRDPHMPGYLILLVLVSRRLKSWPKVQMIEAAGGQIAAQNSASAGDTHWAREMCSLTPLSWVMSPTTFHLTPRRPACRQSARGGKG
jgi:hypothetical protein